MSSPESVDGPAPNVSKRPAKPAYFAAVACALLVAALVVDQLGFASRYQRGSINSDSLYTHAWLRDLLNFGDGFVWLTSAHPFLFPDAILYLIGLLLIDDVGLQFLFYSIAFLLMLILTLGSVVFQLTRSWVTALLLASVSMGSIAIFPDLLTAYRAQVPLANVHGGALLAGVAFMSLSMHVMLAQRVGPTARVALIALAALSTASDLIFPAQFVAPVIAGAAILVAWGDIEKARLVRFVVDNAIAAVLAFLLRQAINATSYVDILRAPWELSYQKVVKALYLLLSEWVPWLGGEIRGPGLALLLAWLALTLHALLKRRRVDPNNVGAGGEALLDRQVTFLVVTANAVMLGSMAAPVLSGVWHGGTTARYVWPVPLLAFLLLIPLVLVAMKVSVQRLNWAAGWAGVVLAISLAVQAAPNLDTDRLMFGPDAIATRLLYLKRVGQISAGLGQYWSARLLTVMSGNEVLVNAVAEDLGPELSLANAARFLGKNGGNPPRYDFIVTNRLDRDRIIKTYGAPSQVEKHGEYEVFLYGRPIGEDIPLRACRRLLELHKNCSLLGPDAELLVVMNVGDAGVRTERGIASVAGKAGGVAYGPYLRLPVGRYEVTWRLSAQPAQTQLRFLIYSQFGRNVVHVESDPQALTRGAVRAVFEVDRRHRDDLWEFPLVADQPADLVLSSVRMRRLD